jgi:hypothetical protein
MAANGVALALLALAGGLFAALGSKKKKPAELPPGGTPAGGGAAGPTEAEIQSAYTAAVDPRQTNIAQMQQASSWLRSVGRSDLADAIDLRVNELRTGQVTGVPQTPGAGTPGASGAAVPPLDPNEVRPTAEQIQQTVRGMLDPRMTNITQLAYAANWLEKWGQQDSADAVRARISELQAAQSGAAYPVSPVQPPIPTVQPSVPAAEPGGAGVMEQPPSLPPAGGAGGVSMPADFTLPQTSVTTSPPQVPPITVEPADQEAPPVAAEEVSPQADPRGSIALARVLIGEESRPNWKTALQEDVRTWQRANGLTADGKFGPNSAVFMAKDVGVLPTIRYWSGWDKAAELAKYRQRINAVADSLAASNPAQAAALRVSAAREQGQGWPKTSAAPIPASTRETEAGTLASVLRTAESTGQDADAVARERAAQLTSIFAPLASTAESRAAARDAAMRAS